MNSDCENQLIKKITQFLQKKSHIAVIICGLMVFLSLHLKNRVLTQKTGHIPSTVRLDPVNKKPSFSFSKLFKFSSDDSLDLLESYNLKEQIEKDLTSFTFIESVKVAAFLSDDQPELSKISLIVAPTPEQKTLTQHQINSIANYLQGTFGELNENMILISDHNGFSYKIDEQGQEEISQTTVENTILALISSRFRGYFPPKHCLFDLHTKINSEKALEVHLHITLNSEFLQKFGSKSRETLIRNFFEKSKILISEQGAIPIISVETIPFLLEDNVESYVRLVPRWMVITIYLMISGIFVMIAYYYLIRKIADTKSIFYPMATDKKQTNLKRLADLLSRQEPQKVALMLSYLNTSRSRELTSLLPEDLQNLLTKENQ